MNSPYGRTGHLQYSAVGRRADGRTRTSRRPRPGRPRDCLDGDMERRGDLRGDHRGAPRRRQPLHLPRGAAHGQRPTGHPPRHLEAVQGHGMPMEDHGGARRRAQGRLGHPRSARRDRGAEETRSDVQRGHRGLWHGGVQREVQGERLDLRGGVARDDRTHGLLD